MFVFEHETLCNRPNCGEIYEKAGNSSSGREKIVGILNYFDKVIISPHEALINFTTALRL